MKHLFLFFFLFLSLYGEVFKVYTEQNPPYNFTEKGKVLGSSTYLANQLFEKTGHQFYDNTIQLLPWAIGYHEVLNEKNTMLFSMIRTPDRELLFQWVGPIGKMTLGIVAKKSRHMVIKTPQDLEHYKIATIPDTASEQFLLNLGYHVESLERFANIASQLKKLKENRVDAIALSTEAIFVLLNDFGCNTADYEVVYVLNQSDLYFAFNKETNPELIGHFNEALKNILK